MKKICIIFFVAMILYFTSYNVFADDLNIKLTNKTHNNEMLVRISQIEVYPQYLDEYLTFSKEVAATSVKKEKGVISIYPMMEIRNNNQIRILEIYKNQEAYKKHIDSQHFQKYKQGTLHMIKSLDLVDMCQIEPTTLDKIFKKN